MKTGLFFGSFNPVHNGHLHIASFCLQEGLDRVLFIVSPQNPLKDLSVLAPEHHRLEMVKLAIQDHPQFEVSDIEFHLPRPSYTYITLEHLSRQLPNDKLIVLLGYDSYLDLPAWKNYKQWTRHYEIWVYPRNVKEGKEPDIPHVRFLNMPLLDISSTTIRKLIASGKDFKKFVPEKVAEYIIKQKLYG